MSTTLIEELEDAIQDTEDAANRECYTSQGRDEVNARAARLRQRAAWVREQLANAARDREMWGQAGDYRAESALAAVQSWLSTLTGPIPSPGTATTEGTDDAK